MSFYTEIMAEITDLQWVKEVKPDRDSSCGPQYKIHEINKR